MKRQTNGSSNQSKAKVKKQSHTEPDYCDVEPVHGDDGSVVWPAAPDAIEHAQAFIQECAKSNERTLIVPDKDADGLDSGVILLRTLTALGLSKDLIDVHLLKKHAAVHDQSEREAMQSRGAKYIIVVDQGSVEAPPIVDSPDTKCLVIDHHLSERFPKDALIVSACHYPPVATSSLLTYEICKPLHPSVSETCGFLCAMGTQGDLGNTLKWKPPFPDMSEVFKTHTKKAISDAVALINAPRRTAKYDVISAWTALVEAQGPKDILLNRRLITARQEINEEVEFRTHTPPKFSKDGKVAVLRINSAAQVHGPIATRWANYLPAKKLEFVMVANSGYKPGFVNFSCRVAKQARYRDPPVNIIDALREYATLDNGSNDKSTGDNDSSDSDNKHISNGSIKNEGDEDHDNSINKEKDVEKASLIDRMGESFARGHKEASGGIVPHAEFEELMALMKIGEKPDPPAGGSQQGGKNGKQISPQKNNLMSYFGKK